MDQTLKNSMEEGWEILCTEYAVSKTGTELYILRAKGPNSDDRNFDLERWEFGSAHGPSCSERTSVEIQADDAYLSLSDQPSFRTLSYPSREPTWKPVAFLAHGEYLRLGTRVLPNALFSRAAHEDLGQTITGYWDDVHRSGDLIVTSRRKQPRQYLSASDEQARIARLKLTTGQRETRGPWISRRISYRRSFDIGSNPYQDEFDLETALDEILYTDDADNGSDLSLGDSNGSSTRSQSADSLMCPILEDEASLNLSEDSSEDDVQSSLSLSSSTASSTRSTDRRRVYEFLDLSKNELHYHEVVAQVPRKSCDVCDRIVYRWLHCFDCLDANFDICIACADDGQWCFDRSHWMLEANDDGVIAIRRYSGWHFHNEQAALLSIACIIS